MMSVGRPDLDGSPGKILYYSPKLINRLKERRVIFYRKLIHHVRVPSLKFFMFMYISSFRERVGIRGW